MHGRKRIFLLGTAILGVFSLGAGFAQSEITIDVLRGIQGIGAAAVIPASLGILAHSFPPSRTRSIAFATFAAGAPMGGALGNLIGGALTQLTAPTWRSSFFLIAGISVATFLGGVFFFDKDVPYESIDRRVDWLGAFLVTSGLVLICFVLSDGSTAPQGWKTGYIIALIVIGVILLILFVLWQYYLERVRGGADKSQSRWTPPPLMKVSIWGRSHGRMAVILAIAFFEWCSFMSWIFWATVRLFFFQLHMRLADAMIALAAVLPEFSAPESGADHDPPASHVCGRLYMQHCHRSRRWSCPRCISYWCVLPFPPALFLHNLTHSLTVCGTTLTAAASLLFALINPSSPYWSFGFPASVISVFGADFVFASGTLFVAKISLPHEQSLAGALFQTMTQLGTSFGLAITTIIYNLILTKQSRKLGVHVDTSGTNAPRSAQLDAYKATMWGGFAFGVLGAVLAAVFLRSVGIVGHNAKSDEAADEERTRTDVGVNDRKEMQMHSEVARRDEKRESSSS